MMSDRAIRVAIVDDQELIRTGFSLILNTAVGDPGFDVVGEAAEGGEALELIARLGGDDRAPDVVLMDVRMPGMNGIEATRTIAQRFPGVRVLVLTTFDLDEYAMEAIEAGASGFLLKDTRAAELIEAVRAVADGDAVMAPSVTQRLLLRLREERPQPQHASSSQPAEAERAAAIRKELTEREQEVFGLIAEGLSNAEIGERLFLSESTVKTHVGRVLTKLGLRDRVHAVILAYEAGLRGGSVE